MSRSMLFVMVPIVVCCGCGKDLDVTGPGIEIIHPGPGHSLSIPDTLFVQVNVNDDRIVRNVWISLTDAAGVPVAPGVSVDVNNPSAVIQRGIVVNSETIPSGSYTLNVRATDGRGNSSNAYRTVNVLEAPLRLRGLFIVPPGGGSITRVDSAGNQAIFHTQTQMGISAINSRSQHLYLAGGVNDPMVVLPTGEGGTGAQIMNQNAGTSEYFTSLSTDNTDGRTYVSSSDGLIRGFHSASDQRFVAQGLSGHRPYRSVVVGDRVVVEQRVLGAGTDVLAGFTYSNGVLLEQFPLDLEITAMFAYSSQQVLVFGNRNGKGVIQLRNVAGGGNFEMREFSEGPMNVVVRLSGNSYAIALPQQVVRFNSTSNSVVPLLNSTVSDLAFEEAGGTLLAGTAAEILVIDPLTGNSIGTIPVSSAIGRILPLFNR